MDRSCARGIDEQNQSWKHEEVEKSECTSDSFTVAILSPRCKMIIAVQALLASETKIYHPKSLHVFHGFTGVYVFTGLDCWTAGLTFFCTCPVHFASTCQVEVFLGSYYSLGSVDFCYSVVESVRI